VRLTTASSGGGGGPVSRGVGKRNGREIVGAGAEKEMHLELRTCFKLLVRAQWARGSAGGRRRAWRPRAEFGQRRG
jgi:hypothetical protein